MTCSARPPLGSSPIPMSEMGQTEKNSVRASSGLLLKADIARCSRHVENVPIGDIERSLELKEVANRRLIF